MRDDGRLGNAQFRNDPTGGQAGLDPRRHRAGMTGWRDFKLAWISTIVPITDWKSLSAPIRANRGSPSISA